MKKLLLFWPVKNIFVGQGFGENLVPLYKELGMKGHNGLDLVCPQGEPVYAAHDGLITYAGLDGSNGWLVVIRTTEEMEYKDGVSHFKTLYGHLLPQPPVVAGQKVRTGDLIAYADTTGKATGPHLHFGLKPVAQGEADWQWENVLQNNGYNGAIDPEPYMSKLTAYQIRSVFQSTSDTFGRILFLWSLFFKGR